MTSKSSASLSKTASNSTADRLPLKTLSIFAFPSIAIAMTHAAAGSILPTIYSKETALDLVQIGSIIFLAKILDALSDPLMGFLSDQTRGRFGRRKPWILIGSIVLAVCIVMLFRVPKDATLMYFAIWYVLTYQAWTLIEIPYRAWSIELTRDYHERSRISTYVAMTTAIGGLLFLALSKLPISPSNAMDGEYFRWVQWIILGVLAVSVPLLLMEVPKGPPVETKRGNLTEAIRAIRNNRPLWIFIAVFFVGGLGGGIISSLVLLYTSSILKLTGQQFTTVMIAYGALSLISTPLWLLAVRFFDKHIVWATGWLVAGLVMPLIAFIEPGPDAFIPYLVIIAIRGIFGAVDNALPVAVIGDIVDYDILKTGVDRTANFIAFLTLILKFNLAIAGAIGFILIGLAGFDPKAEVNTQQARDIFVMIFCFAPMLFYTVSCSILYQFPITSKRHAIIRKRIEQRVARQKRNASAAK
jgi:GPH family glycoside/pentoside/hexuronide:cation symporter